jgi:leucyl aminopeptidase
VIFRLFLFLFIWLSSAVCFASNTSAAQYHVRFPAQVNFIIKHIDPQQMWQNLSVFSTSFIDRSALHPTGVQAADWIKKQAEMLAKYSGRSNVTVYTVATQGKSWGGEPYSSNQYSVILKIGNSKAPAVIIGAHFDGVGCDSDYCKDQTFPAADDDGSGSMLLMEAARAVITSQMKFNKPIYFIWYAGEEEDLWGSQAVVNEFLDKKIPVEAIMQLDQVAYAKNNDLTMYLESDKYLEPDRHPHVDHDLTLFLQALSTKYVGRTAELSCGGGSDNEVWVDLAHVKAVRPVESDYCNGGPHNNPYTHTPDDTIDKLSKAHMTNYLKLAIAFVVEMAEPLS